MNARDLTTETTSINCGAVETTSFPDVWKSDFTTVDPIERRAARYILQFVVKKQIRTEEDGSSQLEAAWKIVTPLLNQTAANIAFNEISHNEENPHKRLQLWQQRTLQELPGDLIARLANDDGNIPVQNSVQILSEIMSLNTIEARILDYLLVRVLSEDFDAFVTSFHHTTTVNNRKRLAALLDISESSICKALLPLASMRSCKLIKYGRGLHCDLDDFIQSTTGLIDIFQAAPETISELSDMLLDTVQPSSWSLVDFPHLATDIARMVKVLPNAAKRGTTGVNGLFFGPPGTGKTEFSKALATGDRVNAISNT